MKYMARCSLTVELLVAAAVRVPGLDVLGDIDDLSLDDGGDGGGDGSLGDGGGGSNDEVGFLARGRSGLLGGAAAAARGLSRAALDLMRGSSRR